MSGLVVRNISPNVSLPQLKDIFGFETTSYTKQMCSCKIIPENPNHNMAVVIAPTIIAMEIAKLNSIELHNESISIEEIDLVFIEVMCSPADDRLQIVNNVTDESILNFILPDEDPTVSSCVLLNNNCQQVRNSTGHIIHAIIATALEIVLPPEKDNMGICKKISSEKYHELLEQQHQKSRNQLSVQIKTDVTSTLT